MDNQMNQIDYMQAQEEVQAPPQMPPLPVRRKKGSLLYSRGLKTMFYALTVLGLTAALSCYTLSEICNYYGYSDETLYSILGLAGSALLFAVCVSLSLIVTGRNRSEEKPQTYLIDRVYTEIHLLIIVITAGLSVSMVSDASRMMWYTDDSSSLGLMLRSVPIAIGAGLMGGSLILVCLLSVMRQFKAGGKNWLLYKFSSQIITFLKYLFTKCRELVSELTDVSRFQNYSFQKKMFMRQAIYVGVLFGMLLIDLFVCFGSYNSGPPAVMICLTILVFGLMTMWYARSNNSINEDVGKIAQQVDEIQKGNLHYAPSIMIKSPLYETSYNLSCISNGFQRSVDERIKSERMKIELVTNVSHDLKTPLTSIISYVDLLSKEENLSPEAKDYVNILEKKSDRLKNIVADLFDLAKVTSGSTELEREVLDMSKLVVQTLADMEDRIEESGQIVKANVADPPVPIFADGKKMYRVLQNIFDNALKYALQGTRIFIDLKLDGKWAALTVKNTASYEMTFTEEEILERFTRGDKARTTEGSGLGLSIAQGFTEANGGSFQISVDGDLFKVCIAFPLHNEVKPPQSEEPQKALEPDPFFTQSTQLMPSPQPNQPVQPPQMPPMPQDPQIPQMPSEPQPPYNPPPPPGWNYL